MRCIIYIMRERETSDAVVLPTQLLYPNCLTDQKESKSSVHIESLLRMLSFCKDFLRDNL